MSVRRYHFTGPFHDPYGAAFCLYKPGDINWRHRIIAGVSWNGQSQEAFFFNPDGLAIPLRANPWEMPAFMRKHGIRREFSTIVGEGPFAMDKQRRLALTAMQLAEWVRCPTHSRHNTKLRAQKKRLQSYGGRLCALSSSTGQGRSLNLQRRLQSKRE